jgi:hypothetical protein
MTASSLFFIVLVVACPLMMMWMMRGGHGHDMHSGAAHEHHDGSHGHVNSGSSVSLEELRRQRDELDRAIEEREAEEKPPMPVGGARR